MLRIKTSFLLCVCALGLSFVCVPASFSQALNSNTASVSLTATLGESLTISATPSAVNFALVSGGVAAGSAPVAITTTWVLGSGRANVVMDAYFSSSAALTFAGPPAATIPTSAVLGQVTTGTPTTFTAFTQTGVLGPAGAGLTLFTQSLSSTNRASTRTDNLNLEIDLSSVPQLPSATYTGTLTLQAQAL